MFIIADTSIWIDHLRKSNTNLINLLREKKILIHSDIIGELSCGNLPNRKTFLKDLKLLPRAFEPTQDEVLELIENKKLFGKGLGLTDIKLFASSYLAGALLWTFDKKLKEIILNN